jgi:hypothetical protein
MFPEYFALIEAVAGVILAVLLSYEFIQDRKNHHLAWMFSMIFWAVFELGVFLHLVYGSTTITEKIVSLLGAYPAALWGVGMLFLLQGFELFPKVMVQKTWPKYFLIYTLIVYSVLIGAVLVAGVQQTAIIFSWILLIIPGAFITISGSISSLFLGRKRNILIATGILLSIIGEQFWFLFHIGLDTIGETLIGLGFLITIEPPLRKVDEK